jgi:hypothetical protein
MSRCSKDALLWKRRWTSVQRLFLTAKAPTLCRAQQPSRQCTTLGTTPERIKEKVLWSQGGKARLLLAAEAGLEDTSRPVTAMTV